MQEPTLNTDLDDGSPQEAGQVRWDVPVEGMTCVNCAGRVERGLAAVPGVTAVRVNVATGSAVVEGEVGLPAVLAAVDASGYRVPVEQLELPVSGMDCASCVSRVDDWVGDVPGVLEATANLSTGLVRIRYVPGLVTPGALVEAVQAAGYDVPELPEPGADPAAVATAIHDREVRRMAWRLALAVPSAILFMVDMFRPEWVTGTLGVFWSPAAQWILATLVLFVAGWPFLHGAWKAGRARTADMNTLIAMGSSAAWAYSTILWLKPDAFGHHTGHLYYDAAVEIIALILAGRLLEAKARQRTGSELRKLVALKPTTAVCLEPDGREVERPVEALRAGQAIVVAAGARVPVDGVVREGRSQVDLSALTGESMPVDAAAGTELAAGAVNLSGRIVLRATRVGPETTLSQMIRLVRDAQGSRAPIQRLADRVSGIFVPVVIVIAVISAVAWALWGPEPIGPNALTAAITVLIISCPCALGLATPTAVIVGVGRGARRGILFKQASAIERLDRIDVLALDKTGTLTEGRPRVVAIWPAAGVETGEVLRSAAALERSSRHPLAQGLIASLERHAVELPPVAEELAEAAGKGLSGRVAGERIWVGRPDWVSTEAGVAPPTADLEAAEAQAVTPIAVAAAGRWIGLVGMADPLRAEAVEVLREIHDRGIHTVLLTGDRPAVARQIAGEVGIDDVRAGLLPAEKLAAIEELRAGGRRVAMIGDGINDAPALAGADLGIAMGAGSDIAAEAGDVVLIRDDLRDVLRSLVLGRATMRTIRQNLFLSFVYNASAIPIAAGILYPFIGLRLEPWMAAAAMVLSDVSVVGNSLRLRARRLPGVDV